MRCEVRWTESSKRERGTPCTCFHARAEREAGSRTTKRQPWQQQFPVSRGPKEPPANPSRPLILNNDFAPPSNSSAISRVLPPTTALPATHCRHHGCPPILDPPATRNKSLKLTPITFFSQTADRASTTRSAAGPELLPRAPVAQLDPEALVFCSHLARRREAFRFPSLPQFCRRHASERSSAALRVRRSFVSLGPTCSAGGVVLPAQQHTAAVGLSAVRKCARTALAFLCQGQRHKRPNELFIPSSSVLRKA